jgi:hypothetical protein
MLLSPEFAPAFEFQFDLGLPEREQLLWTPSEATCRIIS